MPCKHLHTSTQFTTTAAQPLPVAGDLLVMVLLLELLQLQLLLCHLHAQLLQLSDPADTVRKLLRKCLQQGTQEQWLMLRSSAQDTWSCAERL